MQTQSRMQPTVRAVLVFALGLPFALVPALIEPSLWTLWLAFISVALVAVVVDAFAGLPGRRLSIALELPSTLFIGDGDPAILTLEARWRTPTQIEILPDFDGMLVALDPMLVTVPANEALEVALPLQPRRRGQGRFEALWLRWQGPLGLVRRTLRHEVDATLPIVPNTRAVRAAALRLFMSRDFLSGLKAQKYIGDGSEFESLMEYRQGMDHRAMDWKASAKHRKLMCREYRAERNHQVVLAFDTGHLMGEPSAGVPKLDSAINAGLLLAYYSLRSGDRVGLFAFDEKVRQYVEPQGGLHTINRLQLQTADLDYSAHETNFTVALSHLATRLKRRSMIVVLTDFVDTITAKLMMDNLQRLSKRHVVVFVSLRDPALLDVVRAEPRNTTDIHRAVVARDLITERDVVIRHLRRAGVFCIDAPPHAISIDLINRYLDIKRRELI